MHVSDLPSETKTEPCVLCGKLIRLTRHGDGRIWRGRPNYWYTSAVHDCPERAGLQQLNAKLSETLLRKGNQK
jgi:hypothetical protein